jgi:SAM-dependent methyltransferase
MISFEHVYLKTPAIKPKKIMKKIFSSILKVPFLGRRQKPLFVHWGNLRRLEPVSRLFGFDRGQPIDRYYIDTFLKKHKTDIHGRVLEIGENFYARKFGCNAIKHVDVLHAEEGNPKANLIGDLATGKGIPGESFDCMILTQTFTFIYDLKSAIINAYNALKPDGILLATFPGISQISRYDMDRWGDYWRLTSLSAKRLFGEVFPVDHISTESYGNVLTATSFLQGIAAEELRKDELDFQDQDYELLLTVRAVKPKESLNK